MKPGFTLKLISFLSGFTSWQAYGLILGILLACGLGLPIPEDITLLSAGILAALGKISLLGAFISGLVGVLIGDCFMFFLGKKYGRKVFELPGFRKVFTEERIQIAEEKVHANSRFICFTARFLPGLRSPVFLTAGILGVPFKTFILLDGGAALISVPVWVYLGHLFGENLDTAIEYAKRTQALFFIGVVVIFIGYVIFKRRVKSKKTKEPKIKTSSSSFHTL